jgi:hypothetical protein
LRTVVPIRTQTRPATATGTSSTRYSVSVKLSTSAPRRADPVRQVVALSWDTGISVASASFHLGGDVRVELRTVGQRGVIPPHVDDDPLTAERDEVIVLFACDKRSQRRTILDQRRG